MRNHKGFVDILLLTLVGAAIVASAVYGVLTKREPAPVDPAPALQELNSQQAQLDMLQRQRLQEEINALTRVVESLEDQVRNAEKLGATIPVGVADFETSLQASISDTATEMTLVATSTDDGTSLTLGTVYGFVLDGNSASKEYVFGTASSGRKIVSMSRGVSVITGNTEITALKKTHRRGASVAIADAPLLLVVSRILNGDESLPNTLRYSTGASSSITTSSTLASKGYADSLVAAGVPDANYDTFGGVVLATTSQLAAGTATSTATRYLVAASESFSSTSAARIMVPVTNASGDIDDDFIPTNITHDLTVFNNDLELQASAAGTADISFTDSGGTLGRVRTYGASNTVQFAGTDTNLAVRDTFNFTQQASSTAWNAQVPLFFAGSFANFFATTTLTGNWTAASGTSRIFLQLVGSGGGGASAASDGGGGGGGGTCYDFRTVAPNATGTWTIGAAGGVGTVASSTTFYSAGATSTATGGSPGTGPSNGGAGGSFSGCDFGVDGLAGQTVDATDAWTGLGGATTLAAQGRGGNGNAGGANGAIMIFEYR